MNKKAVIAFMFVFALAAVPLVSATVSGSGPETTILGMPVQWTFTGLTASTDYELVCTTGTNSTIVAVATSDSDGDLTLTIDDYNDYGVNHYVLQPDGGGSPTYEFNIDNMDIIPYFLVLITFTILLAVLRMFGGGRRGGGLL